jgi:hypothetical protein
MAMDEEGLTVVDLALGATGRAVAVAVGAARGAAAAARGVSPVVDPFARLARQVPVPDEWRPSTRLAALSREGAIYRGALVSAWTALLDAVVPFVLTEVLARAHLTDLVLRFVDLDEIVAAVDLDRAVARVDLDAAVSRVDVDAVVKQVDIEAIIDRVDVDAVAERLDINLVLDRMDLTNVVLERVDLEALVDAILAKMDLIALADEIIEGVDLPDIIRQSTGTMASDTVQGVRMQGIAADDAISRAVDRFLLRHGRRSTKAPNGTISPDQAPHSSDSSDSPSQPDSPGGDALASPGEPAP